MTIEAQDKAIFFIYKFLKVLIKMMNLESEKEEAIEERKKYVIKRLKDMDIVKIGTVKLSHGGFSNCYYDIKKACGDPRVLNALVDLLYEKMDRMGTCVVGKGCGGIALASAFSSRYFPYLTMIRDEPKEYGTKKQIEGYEPHKGDTVIIIDDVSTTGKTFKEIINVIEPTEAEILGCYVVVKRKEIDLEYPLIHLFTPEDFR